MLNAEELERLKILEDYQILDTLPEEMFDDITSMASSICDMPISLISLIDQDRQFFKSHHGMEINEIPLELSICKHFIESKIDYLEVVDLREDSRFKNNPLVSLDPKIISYFGISLKTITGVAFGTLCVIGKDKKELTNEQKNTLKLLSKQVVNLLELRKSNFLLKSYQKKIEDYNLKSREFIFIAAHDLKAPIRGIDSFLKIIETKNNEIWDEKDRKYFNVIFDNVTRMNKLINDLMDYCNSTTLELQYEEIDIDKLVKDVFENLTKNLKIEEAQLSTKNLPKIYSSNLAMSLIFQNLINNALNYQSINNIPKIEISCDENKNHWYLDVKDNGIGISNEYFDTIFKPFKRLHTQTEYQGSGLGLAACKKLVEKMNGEIRVESELEKGTIIKIRLPK
jgi:signal transduction histidine kinase